MGSDVVAKIDKRQISLVNIDEMKLRLLIITKNKNLFQAVAAHLKKRGWEAELEDSVKDSFQKIVSYRPDFILFSVNMPTKKREKLPMLYFQTFHIPVVLFGENGDVVTTTWLHDIETNYKMQGQLTGPSAHRRIKNILHFIRNEEDAVGREIFERHVSEVARHKVEENEGQKSEERKKNKGKKLYSIESNEEATESPKKKKVPAYLERLAQEEEEFRKLKRAESKEAPALKNKSVTTEAKQGANENAAQQIFNDEGIFTPEELEAIKLARQDKTIKLNELLAEDIQSGDAPREDNINEASGSATVTEEPSEEQEQADNVRGSLSVSKDIDLTEDAMERVRRLADEIARDEEDFDIEALNRAAQEYRKNKSSDQEEGKEENTETRISAGGPERLKLLNEEIGNPEESSEVESVEVSHAEKKSSLQITGGAAQLSNRSKREAFAAKVEGLFGRVAKISMESVDAEVGTVTLADDLSSKRKMERVSCVIPVVVSGQNAFIVVSHEIEIGQSAKFDKKFIDLLRVEVSKISSEIQIHDKAYESIEVIDQDDQLDGEVFTKVIESESGKIVLKYVDGQNYDVTYEHIEKDQKYKVHSKYLVAEKSQGADIFLHLPKNGRYFLYLKKHGTISQKQIEKLNEADVYVYIKEAELEEFKKTHQRNMAQPVFDSAKKFKKIS